jgi:ABC-type branched-subunit amino acid transport system ATPase component/ABC-type branched-subunit amino acid transport system permease subunit
VKTRGLAILALACGLAIVVVLPLAVTSRYATNLVVLAAAWSIATLGLTILLGYTGQISLAQATFYGIGAYAVALGTTRFGLDFWVALPIGLGLAAGMGFVLGMTTLKLGGHYLAMVTICFQIIFSLLAINWAVVTGGPDGISNIARPALIVPLGTAQRYAWFSLGVLLAVASFVAWLKHTSLGRSMRAVRENELAAEALGVDTFRVKVTAFTLSAAIAALGGAIYAAGFRYISPDGFGLDHSVELLAMVLVGGSDSVPGSILGAALLTFLPEWLRDLKNTYLVVYGAAIILVIVFMPEGLWGWARLLGRRFLRPAPIGAAQKPVAIGGKGAPGEPILTVQGLGKHFGGLQALDGVDFSVRRGEVHALIGPNGSGKTTCLNLVSGLYVPSSGVIRFLGRSIVGLRPNRIARRGMARTFQNLRLFRELSVWENVLVGAQCKGGREAEIQGRARAALEFVGLVEKAHLTCKNLPYGHQKLVEIARALAAEVELLLLDEPAAGLNQSEKREIGLLLTRLRERGLTVLLVEHDMSLVAQVSGSITVLNFGKRISDGAPAQVLKDPVVVEAYLGKRDGVRANESGRGSGGKPLLVLSGVHASYGSVRALNGVSMEVREGEIVALLGANGAGKSTVLRTVSGLVRPQSGSLSFDGASIHRSKPEALVRLGLAHVPEGRRIFPGLTVEENLRLGATVRSGKPGIEGDLEKMLALFPDLGRLRGTLGWKLSGGQQQMLAIGRGLMGRPRLLLLDEPSLGLAPVLVRAVFQSIGEINRTLGTTVLVVEQNASMALGIASRGYVLEGGRVALAGPAAELLEDPEVREAYLGGKREDRRAAGDYDGG